MSRSAVIVDTRSLREAGDLLDATPRECRRAVRSAVDKTLRSTRKDLAIEMAQAVGVKRSTMFDGLRVALYDPGKGYGKLTPSGRGIYVENYIGWNWQPVPGSHVRARIFVPWFGGQKLAAGFVNQTDPSRPWRTRRDNRSENQRTAGTRGSSQNKHGSRRRVRVPAEPAVGLAPGAIFKELLRRNPGRLDGLPDQLAKNFDDALMNQLRKRPA